MIGCEHPKEPRCVWCFACGANRAGPKPEATFEIGAYAIGHGMTLPGEIVEVTVELHGLAVENPAWVERVQISHGDGSWSGPAEEVTRLVEGLTERRARGFAQVLFLIGSRTDARFDQWLRHGIGDEDADAVLAWLHASGVDVDRFGKEKAAS